MQEVGHTKVLTALLEFLNDTEDIARKCVRRYSGIGNAIVFRVKLLFVSFVMDGRKTVR